MLDVKGVRVSLNDWTDVLTPWAALGVLALVLWRTLSLRSRAVNQAGKLLLRVPQPRARRWWIVLLVLWSFVLVTQAVSLSLGTVRATELLRAVGSVLVPVLALWVYLTSGGCVHIEARENGIVLGSRFWPWPTIRGHTWPDHGSTLRLQLQGYGFEDFRLAASQKDALDRLLQEKRYAPVETERNLSVSQQSSVPSDSDEDSELQNDVPRV